jgi:hypothetical protein
MSADGNMVVAAAYGGGIYLWQPAVPVIVAEPQTTTNVGAANAVLSVGVFTTALPQYQWMFDGNPITGATNSSLVLTDVALTNAGSYSVLVSNVNGSSLSSNGVLTVVPAFVSTLAASWGASDSFISGSVTAGSNSTVAWFDWGATTNFGNETGPITVPEGASPFAFTNHLTGLQPFTTYYYQAVASNSFGIATGAIASFTTAPRFVQTTGANGGWTAFAWSADGGKILASQNGPLFFSTNQGASWMSTGGSGTLLAVSADGTSCFAINGTNSWFSTNQGESWMINSTPSAFSLLACSANLEDVFASDGANIYASTNAGMTWTITSVPSPVESVYGWVALVCSSDGSRLFAVRLVAGDNRTLRYNDLCISANGGATWGDEGSYGQYWSSAIAVSSSATTVYYSLFDYLMESTNGGGSWFNINPSAPFGTPPTSLATSADASTVADAVPPSVYAYRAGVWAQANAPGVGPLLCSADGNELALLYNGAIYIAQLTSSPQLNAVMSSNGIVLSWTVPSSPATLQQSFNLRTWQPVTNAAALNNTNLQNQVTLPTSKAQAFYRLGETN